MTVEDAAYQQRLEEVLQNLISRCNANGLQHGTVRDLLKSDVLEQALAAINALNGETLGELTNIPEKATPEQRFLFVTIMEREGELRRRFGVES